MKRYKSSGNNKLARFGLKNASVSVGTTYRGGVRR